MIEALSPGLIALGLCLAVLPWLDRESTTARAALGSVSAALLLHYWRWRVTHTLPPQGLTADSLVGSVFLVAETAALAAGALALLFLSRTRNRTAELEANRHWFERRPPPVDVFICTYNEEASILERTI